MGYRREVFAKQRVASVQTDTAPRISWRIAWRRLVKRSEKTREFRRYSIFIEAWRLERCFTTEPARYAPRPGKSACGSANADRSGDLQRQQRRKDRKPALLVLDEGSGYGAARQTNCQFVSEPERPVIPSFPCVNKGKRGEIGVLLLEQRADEDAVDCYFRGRRLHLRPCPSPRIVLPRFLSEKRLERV